MMNIRHYILYIALIYCRFQVRHNMFGSEKPVRYAPKTKLKVDTVAGDKSKNKGSLVLPSHSGPKVRHKRRAAPVSAPKTPKDSVVVQVCMC
jgi:hypothetical protein